MRADIGRNIQWQRDHPKEIAANLLWRVHSGARDIDLAGEKRGAVRRAVAKITASFSQHAPSGISGSRARRLRDRAPPLRPALRPREAAQHEMRYWGVHRRTTTNE